MSLSGLSTSQANLARRAAARWQQVIVGDLPDITFQGTRIDDIAIQIGGQYIDGAGNILGQGGPTGYRSDTLIPCAGRIILDTADMSQLESQGELLDVFTHEIAHVLGFGIFWQQKGLLTGANGTNPQFTGRRALAEYNALFHTNVAGVPVEANGGQGTALSHWRDTVFNTELMTGWNKRGASPLSRVTIASMADLGYVVNMAAADAYTANARSIRALQPRAAPSSPDRLLPSLGRPAWRRAWRPRRSAVGWPPPWTSCSARPSPARPIARTRPRPSASRARRSAGWIAGWLPSGRRRITPGCGPLPRRITRARTTWP